MYSLSIICVIMLKREQLLLVGKIVGVHGIKGQIKILPYGDCNKKPWKRLYLLKQEHNLVYEVLDNKPQKGILLVRLKDCNNRNSAGQLVNYEVFVDKNEFPSLPEGEYYNFQLDGMTIVTDEGKFVGNIIDIFSTGSNDVYVVKGPLGDILIPAISDVVVKVDIEERKMIVHMLEGLLPEEK